MPTRRSVQPKTVEPAPKKRQRAEKPPVKSAGKKSPAKVRAASVGRPTSYKPEYAELAKKFALLGASDEQMAELFGIAVSTVYQWKLAHPEFSEAVKEGKVIADAQVASALYHRALGYSHPEVDIRTVAIGGGVSEIVETPITKHYPPDTSAATLWLKNRQPSLWRDKVENVVTGSDGGPLSLSLRVEYVRPQDE